MKRIAMRSHNVSKHTLNGAELGTVLKENPFSQSYVFGSLFVILILCIT